MRPDLDPSELTPDERLREAAALVARAILRLRNRAALPTEANNPSDPETLPNDQKNHLS